MFMLCNQTQAGAGAACTAHKTLQCAATAKDTTVVLQVMKGAENHPSREMHG